MRKLLELSSSFEEADKKGSQLPNTRNITDEMFIPVTECGGCGAVFSSKKAEETREKIDILYEINRKKESQG